MNILSYVRNDFKTHHRTLGPFENHNRRVSSLKRKKNIKAKKNLKTHAVGHNVEQENKT